MPKVSVIMPAYNAEKYISEAIDSILQQTFTDFELIIINDCSCDATEEIVLSYQDPRMIYFKNEKNMGVAGTLNKGLALAHGEYIARMDSDDIAMPDRLACQVEYLDNNPRLVACGSNAILFGAVEKERATDVPLDSKGVCLRMALSNPFVHPTMMLRKGAVQEIGYDETFEGREDYRLWMVLSQKGPMGNLPQPLLRYRIHKGQVTQRMDAAKAQKHFHLKKTYYQELGIGLTEPMQDALCHAAYYGKVNDELMVTQLKLGMEQLIAYYGIRRLPMEYCSLLSCVLLPFSRNKRWTLSKGLPLKMRLALLR